MALAAMRVTHVDRRGPATRHSRRIQTKPVVGIPVRSRRKGSQCGVMSRPGRPGAAPPASRCAPRRSDLAAPTRDQAEWTQGFRLKHCNFAPLRRIKRWAAGTSYASWGGLLAVRQIGRRSEINVRLIKRLTDGLGHLRQFCGHNATLTTNLTQTVRNQVSLLVGRATAADERCAATVATRHGVRRRRPRGRIRGRS